MRVQKIKLWLWGLSGGLVVCAVSVVALAWWWPYETPDDSAVSAQTSSVRPQIARPVEAVALPPANDAVWLTPLRQPLHDQPTQGTVATAPQAPPPDLSTRLAGTVIEPGWSLAMFITQDGKVALKAVGESVDNAEVLDITPQRVSLQYNGQTVDLILEKKEGL